jgi:hypothetical protein
MKGNLWYVSSRSLEFNLDHNQVQPLFQPCRLLGLLVCLQVAWNACACSFLV